MAAPRGWRCVSEGHGETESDKSGEMWISVFVKLLKVCRSSASPSFCYERERSFLESVQKLDNYPIKYGQNIIAY